VRHAAIAPSPLLAGLAKYTAAQSPMDPNLPDGQHRWGTRLGATFTKKGNAVYLGTSDTLAGRYDESSYKCGIVTDPAVVVHSMNA
jgi:hypothetical protein